jgi:hypothetical protein
MKKQASLTLENEWSKRAVEQLAPGPASDSPSTLLALIKRVSTPAPMSKSSNT